jgi:hypothetical protein
MYVVTVLPSAGIQMNNGRSIYDNWVPPVVFLQIEVSQGI